MRNGSHNVSPPSFLPYPECVIVCLVPSLFNNALRLQSAVITVSKSIILSFNSRWNTPMSAVFEQSSCSVCTSAAGSESLLTHCYEVSIVFGWVELSIQFHVSSPFSRFFLVLSRWSFSMMRTCLSLARSLMKACLSRVSVVGRWRWFLTRQLSTNDKKRLDLRKDSKGKGQAKKD